MDSLLKLNVVASKYESPLEFESFVSIDGETIGDKNFELERELK